jgi:hypothetical protein
MLAKGLRVRRAGCGVKHGSGLLGFGFEFVALGAGVRAGVFSA